MLAERPLFDCFRCGMCCYGEGFTYPQVFLSREEEKGFPAAVESPNNMAGYKFKFLPVIQDDACEHGEQFRCVNYDVAGRSCRIHGQHPLDCQLYPFRLIGNNLVINSECPDSEQFTRRWKKGEPAAVAHINKLLALLQGLADKKDFGLLEMIRRDSFVTDNLTVFGRIIDPTVENWASIEACREYWDNYSEES